MILDGLHDNVWQMTTSLPSTVKQPFQLMDRLWMYQQLLPFYFSIDVYKPGANPDPSNSPTYSANNVNYFLKDQNGYISASQFSGTTLYSDLFTTIGVTEEDFFAGHGGWSSIPRQVFKRPEQSSLSASGDLESKKTSLHPQITRIHLRNLWMLPFGKRPRVCYIESQ